MISCPFQWHLFKTQNVLVITVFKLVRTSLWMRMIVEVLTYPGCLIPYNNYLMVLMIIYIYLMVLPT